MLYNEQAVIMLCILQVVLLSRNPTTFEFIHKALFAYTLRNSNWVTIEIKGEIKFYFDSIRK